jgi:hypothetical protein
MAAIRSQESQQTELRWSQGSSKRVYKIEYGIQRALIFSDATATRGARFFLNPR